MSKFKVGQKVRHPEVGIVTVAAPHAALGAVRAHNKPLKIAVMAGHTSCRYVVNGKTIQKNLRTCDLSPV